MNRLQHETSPYLRQHATNPVDWYPWGPEALARARTEDRPIFLSIGYSACHWCHVMEHESFEHAEVAGILNAHFVSIKVDREERPDLDQVYMTAVQMLTGQGGWPMSVFLTPDLQPFYGGTYFPPDDRYGRPGFKRLLLALADAWKNRRAEVLSAAGQLTEQLIQVIRLEPPASGELDASLLRNAAGQLVRIFDPVHGGFGAAPKFPHATEIRLLLRAWRRFRDDHSLHVARFTLEKMARGGIRDHLGGGFHRYSTDERWLVPHFEKMLYDNALLAVAYLEAFQAVGDPFFREVVTDTLDYVLREMTAPEGPFYSAQDADSEGVEGKFFVWTPAEIDAILGKDGELFREVYDVTEEGNWEGHNILHRVRSDEQEAKLRRIDEAELRTRLAGARQRLYAARMKRVPPARDDKVLTAWNGLMIDALAQASGVLDRPDYAAAARRAADFVLTRLRTPEGRLLRTWSAGGQAKLNAYLEDYAFLAHALCSLYEATFETRWLRDALALADGIGELFWDPADAGFFFTGNDHERLLTRAKDTHDGSTPSGSSMAVTAFLRLAAWTGRADLRAKADSTLRLYRGMMATSPTAAGQMLAALDFHLGPTPEIAVVGDPQALDVWEALRRIRAPYWPNKVVALGHGDTRDDVTLLPLLAGKKPLGPLTTYVCRNFACDVPRVGLDALGDALRTLAF